jgi:hypothetical protein
MIKTILIGLLLASILTISRQCVNRITIAKNGRIQITWTNNLPGDFSFTNKWSYPEGIFKNNYNQLVCDGFCPERSYSMKDNLGQIFPDSIKAYYQLIDTTHLFHSINCEAWCYEWAGTEFIKAQYTNGDTIKCETEKNVATHCSLNLIIIGNSCIPTIELFGIADSVKTVYTCSNGYINIDNNFYKSGILKMEFNFNFYHPESPEIKMFWKGRAFTAIKK